MLCATHSESVDLNFSLFPSESKIVNDKLLLNGPCNSEVLHLSELQESKKSRSWGNIQKVGQGD